ncbi:MAG: hypothetical protein U0V75_02265 [Ferruginibacter sp.]
MKKLHLLFALSAIIIYNGCKKNDSPPPEDPCSKSNIVTVASKTHTITGQLLGTITVTSPIGSEYTYSINNGSFQPSTNFFNLAAGSYIVTTKSTAGCTDTANITINGYGPKFYAVRTIVNGYCGPCHLNGTVNGGKNFDDDNSIVNAWDRIKVRTVDGTPSFMPEGGQLTAPDKQKILDWVNAGHRVTD